MGSGLGFWFRWWRGLILGCDCGYKEACDRLDALLRDVASLRLRVEEVLGRSGEAARVDPEAEAKAAEEAAERERQRAEAFLRMRDEQGKTDEVDDDDRDYLSQAWMNG